MYVAFISFDVRFSSVMATLSIEYIFLVFILGCETQLAYIKMPYEYKSEMPSARWFMAI